MQAGQDITMTGATLAALGENGSMILSAGHNLTMDTDSLEAKKDMGMKGSTRQKYLPMS